MAPSIASIVTVRYHTMSNWEQLLRPLLFHCDPEWVHDRAMAAIEKGLVKGKTFADPRLQTTKLGIEFPNPIGLAAGFDKNARAISKWGEFGFGFAEMGTITALAQPGNPKPRLFRLPEDQAIINRFGFNNAGAQAIADRITGARSTIPIGINIGKSKITELDQAPKDYADSFQKLGEFGDYFVINVSSPNTPGLRTLQDKAPLIEIVEAMLAVRQDRSLLIKISPDLDHQDLDAVVQVVRDTGIQGIIATNTTLDRTNVRSTHASESGGLSGKPLLDRANNTLKIVAQQLTASHLVIGVGGIFTVQDVLSKIQFGADLVQLYTGWVYGGPGLVAHLCQGLSQQMVRDGVQHLSEYCEINRSES
jgi:dihydroorotate dehydrogenase